MPNLRSAVLKDMEDAANAKGEYERALRFKIQRLEYELTNWQVTFFGTVIISAAVIVGLLIQGS